jgi:phage tail sheath protein FI
VRTSVLVGLTALALAATAAIAVAATGALPNIGKAKMTAQPVYRGYYDHHIDTYLITDTSSKAQANAMHVNFSAAIGKEKGLPKQYFVKGRAAAGQVTIFGSEPGETDYNPLWEEIWVTWKKGVKPVLLYRDDQIDGLAAKGKLTEKDAHIALNAPILKVGKGG